MKHTGSGKVIASSAYDRIFVYFAGHGGPGVIAFPNPPNNLVTYVFEPR